jgi:transcriptional regulator with XRE-family HTH domain
VTEAPAPSGPFKSENLRWLFANVPRVDGSRHTLTELADFVSQHTGESCSLQYISKLYHGQSTNPTARVLDALGEFWAVSPAYFLEGTRSAQIQAQLDLVVMMGEPEARIALRDVTATLQSSAPDMTAAQLRLVDDLIKTIRRSHSQADDSNPSPKD